MRELILRFDVDAVTWVCTRRRRGFDASMRWITHLGDGPLWGALAFGLAFVEEGGVTLLLRLALAYGLELGVYTVAKKNITRRRPFADLPWVTGLVLPPDEYSFPSGHTAAAFVMTVVGGSMFPILLPFLLGLALLIGGSRIYLGVHYPTDVLAGALLGTFSGLFSLVCV